MKRHYHLALALLAGTTLGCGGSDGGSSPPVARFAGHYLGTWRNDSDYGDGVNGSLDVVVDAQGVIAGSMTHSQYGNGMIEEGTIRADGRTRIVSSFPSHDEVPWGMSGVGRLTQDAQGNLRGTLARDIGDFDIPDDYVLTRQTD